MSGCLTRVSKALGQAESKKITELKNFMQAMQDLYSDEEVVEAINIISATNLHSATSWNSIMLVIHRLIISLGEKAQPISKSWSSFRSGCCTLLINTVNLATSTSNKLLSCNNFMAMAFEILGNGIYKFFQETYINVLVNRVLTNKLYRMSITGNQWRKILSLSQEIYQEGDNADVYKSTILQTASLAVQFGCLQSHLLFDVKKMLPFLEQIFKEIGSGKEMMVKPLYNLTYAVCQQIGTESRVALCEFSEKCLPHIVSLVSCIEKYDLMMLFVRIHHPSGASAKADAAYACDWELWKNIMRGIHANIIRDLKAEKLPPSLLRLACEVYRQIMKDSTYAMPRSSNSVDGEEFTQPHKRRRLSLAVEKPIDMLTGTNLEITWPFVQILTALLRKYPDCLKSSDYVAFLKTVTDLVTAAMSKDDRQSIMESLCELCTVLVVREKEYLHEGEQTEIANVCWEKIWDTVLRALSTNHNHVAGHELLQSIIEHRNITNPNAFLQLYLTDAIRWSSASVGTLLKFCNYVPIPSELTNSSGTSATSESSVRLSLMRWTLNIPTKTLLTAIPVSISLAKLLTALAVKSSYKREFRQLQDCHDLAFERKIAEADKLERELFEDREAKALDDIERCHLALEFRGNLFDEPETPRDSLEITSMKSVPVDEVLDALVATLTDLLSDNVREKNIAVFLMRMTIVAKLYSNFTELNVRAERHMKNFESLYTQNMIKVIELLEKIDTKKGSYVVHIIEALKVLYCARYHWEFAKVLVHQTPISLIKFVYEFIPNEDPQESSASQSFGRRARPSDNQESDSYRIRNSAHKVLTYYCSAWTNAPLSANQERALKNLMKPEIYEDASSADLKLPLMVLKIFGSTAAQQLHQGLESLENSIAFMQKLYNSRATDETAVRGLLNVLPHFVEASLKLEIGTVDLMSLLSSIHERLIDEAVPIFGPQVEADFVKCLTQIIRLDPLLKLRCDDSVESSIVARVLLGFVDNPFYLVRVEVILALHAIFTSSKLQPRWKLKFIGQVKSEVAKLFIIDELPDGSEKTDELHARTRTAVHIFAAMIRSGEFYHGRALLACIEMTVRIDVTPETLKKALLSVLRDEAEQLRLLHFDLHYLLTRWFEADYPLQRFPFILANCESQEDFSKKHIGALVMIKLQRQEFEDLIILCRNLQVSFEQTVENYFPSIVALLLSMIVGDGPGKVYGTQMYHRFRANTDEFVTVSKFNELLDKKLADVIAELVKRLYDSKHSSELFELPIFLPALKPPNFNAATVLHCLDRLENDLQLNGKSLIAYLVTQRPSVLQKVLSTLICNIHEVISTDYCLQVLHQYAFFYSAVIDELSNSYFDPMSLYIVRDISHSLLGLIKEERCPLSRMAGAFFNVFLKKSLPTRANEIKQVLSYTVSTLIPIIQSGKVPGLELILHTLIIDHKQVLAEAIKKLDSFPNEPGFELFERVHNSLKYRINRDYSLEDEIEHFLNATHEKTLSCSLEGLSHVKNLLSSKKTALRDMYNDLEGLRGFAEDCARSTLHRLVYKLMQLTRSSDAAISLEAAKCLGELGPADLTTMILHPENGYCKEIFGDEVPMLTLNVVRQLADYLLENSVALRVASADALYAIFSTTWGRALFNGDLFREEFALVYANVYPFGTKTRKVAKHTAVCIDRESWSRCIDGTVDDLWKPVSSGSYPKWIVELSCRLLDCFENMYAESLKAVCRLSVEFCESLLPRLVNLIMRTDDALVDEVCNVIDRFFRIVFELINETDLSLTFSDSQGKREMACGYECVRCMLNVVNFMRIQSIDVASLSLDYLRIARAAQHCSAYFTSILYAELWCTNYLESSRLLMDKQSGSWISAIDAISEADPEMGKLLQDVVREASLHIGDPDAIYGCGLSHFNDSSFRTQHYVHMRQWDKVMIAQDVDMSCGGTAPRGMLHALQQSGLQYLLGCVINTVSKEAENVDDFMYEAAWRLSNWNIQENHRVVDSTTDASLTASQNFRNTDYYASHYQALKCLCDSDIAGLKIAVENARACIVKTLRNTSLECSQTVYPILSQLQILREMEDFATVAPDLIGDLFLEWSKQDYRNTHDDFQYVEPILSQRLVMCHTRNPGGADKTLRSGSIMTLLEIAAVAEKQGYFPIAARSLETLTRMQNTSSTVRNLSTYREALLAWNRKDQYTGRRLLRNLIKQPVVSVDPNLRAKALLMYGNWMAETKSENPKAVIEKYYNESLAITGRSEESPENLEVYFSASADLAQFADAQYQQMVEFMKSPQYESLAECPQVQQTMTNGRAGQGVDQLTRKIIILHQRQVENDTAELENIKVEKEMYLLLAVRHYVNTLKVCDKYDLLIFRLVSLWLDNTFDPKLNELLDGMLPAIPSHKFVTLVPQLAPHMSEANIFTTKIYKLMIRCAMEHPHHTLPVLFALRNTYKDTEFQPPNEASQNQMKKNPEGRIRMANQLLTKLANTQIGPIVEEMSELSDALIMFAYYEAKAKQLGPHKIPSRQAIMKVRNYVNINMPTVTLDVRPSGKYDDIVGIREYETTFEIPGGASVPKKVICIGTDGIKRIQLVKGCDDLRQDAVMQQVCTVMNSMLKASKETKRRKLHIRTYKIVPLSQRSGVLEWCKNTLPLSVVLTETKDGPGLHAKYYPKDWKAADCRKEMAKVSKAPTDKKLSTFLEICKHMHPAFHHFFTEQYPSAETWFERRLAYTRSVATTSMVGYMLGLGDRHVSNILIDQTTAEVIHIDFGIAFAQGKVLSIPETVPFRLTRDMEVAMGICGVEGVMRRSCEETVAVLRENRKILITLLQVLLYDPLFSWAMMPLVSSDAENCDGTRYTNETTSIKPNKLAKRALLKIEQKLQGTEDGLVSSIPGQVERLIQQARDPANLCRLFCGWQPYL